MATVGIAESNPTWNSLVHATFDGLSGGQENKVRIRLFAYQADGTVPGEDGDTEPDMVFVYERGAIEARDNGFTLGGDGSWWLGGEALCHMELYLPPKRNEALQILATYDFVALG
jgi:hypothetical protein